MGGRDISNLKRTPAKKVWRECTREKCPGNKNVSVWPPACIDKPLVSESWRMVHVHCKETRWTKQAGCRGKENHFKEHRKPLQRHTQQVNSSSMNLDIDSLEETIDK